MQTSEMSVKLYDVGAPTPLVKAVYVLGYHHFYDPELFQFPNCPVSGIWTCLCEKLVHFY